MYIFILVEPIFRNCFKNRLTIDFFIKLNDSLIFSRINDFTCYPLKKSNVLCDLTLYGRWIDHSGGLELETVNVTHISIHM